MGWINVDMLASLKPDQIVRLDVEKWPWPDNSCTDALAFNLLEHIGRGPQNQDLLMHFLNEAHRVLIKGGRFTIRVPDSETDLRSAIRDPTHCRFFCRASFDYWNHAHQTYRNYGRFYGYRPWKLISINVAKEGPHAFLDVVQVPVK